MPVPHDPAHHARLTFRWRDEHWHLLDGPTPAVVLVSPNVTRGDEYPDPEAAEASLWASVVDSILAAADRLASAEWPGVEIAALLDRTNSRAVVAERTRRNGPRVQVYEGRDAALQAFQERVQALITKCENAA